MQKNSYIFNFKQLPLAFLGAIVLFLVFQCVLLESKSFWRFCYLYSTPGRDDALRVEAQLKLLSVNDKNIRVFLIGSSQTREDFDTDYLNKYFSRANVNFCNFGIAGTASPIDMFMLKDKLSNKKPVFIFYMPYIESFYMDKYDFSTMVNYFEPSILPYFLRYEGFKDIVAQRGYFIDSFLGKIFLFYRYRESFVRILYTAINYHISGNKISEPLRYAHQENRPKSYFIEEIKKAGGNRYKTNSCLELNKVLFCLFAKDIISKGIKLIVLDGPTHPLFKECYRKEINYEYNDFLRRQSLGLGFIYLDSNNLPKFNETEFIDFTHLNEKGRTKFNNFIAQFLSSNYNKLWQ